MSLKAGLKCALALTLALNACAALGAGPIKVWYPLGYSKTDSGGHRYFAVATDSYKFVYDLGHPGMTELYNLAKGSSGPNLLQTGSTPGGFLLFMDGTNKTYLSHLSNGNALVTVTKGPNSFPNMYQTRMTFRQAGRPYYQIDVIGIKLAASDGSIAPVTVRQRFHLWPEKLYVETSFTVDSDTQVRFAEDVASYNPAYFSHVSSAALSPTALIPGFIYYLGAGDPCIGIYDGSGSYGSLGHICVNRAGTDSLVFYDNPYYGSAAALNFIHRAYDYDVRGGYGTWHAGETHTIYSQRFFSSTADSSGFTADAQIEANPATVTKVTASNGTSGPVSYDNTSGVYRVEIPQDITDGANAGYIYSEAFQNYYDTARLQIVNNPSPRQLRLKMVRGSSIAGSTPWGEMIITDAAGFPLGVPTEQNSRWGGGELDAYFACYGSMPLAAGETKDLQLKIVSQNWGKKPMMRMQCQDLYDWEGGADEQQWMQSSIGQGENMVYHLQRVWCTMEDVRGLNSRPLGDSNAWRDNCGGWEFLKLASGVRPDTQSMVYQKSGPNLFDFTLNAAMDDGSITSTVRVMAFPANECTRTFFHIRYDVKSTVTTGDIASNVRLFALGDENYGAINYPSLAYTNSTGTVVTQSAASSFTRRAIGGTNPWACTYGASPPIGSGGNRGFIIKNYRARVNGATNNSPAITLNAGSQTRLILTSASTATRLISGDYFEFDLEGVAFGTPTSDYSQMVTEAAAWGYGKPTVPTVYQGSKVSDFPARVDIGANGYADFTIAGGRDMLPVEIGGFPGYTNSTQSDLRIEELVSDVWIPIDQSYLGRDWWHTEYDGTTGKYSFILALHTDGSSRRFRVGQTMNKSEAESFTNSSGGLAVFQAPLHVGGYYAAGSGNSPIIAGQWLTYAVTNTSAATRRFTPLIRYAAPVDSAIHLEINGANQTGTIALPSTGGANVWQTLPLADVVLNSGANTAKVVIESGGPYLDWIEYRLDRPATQSADDAAPLVADVPYNVTPTTPATCAITMRNTGTNTWTPAGGYGLACDNEFGSATFRPIASDVAPGSSYRFAFTCAAPPAVVQLYQPRWQMKRASSAFGVPVSCPLRSSDLSSTIENAMLVSDDIPVRMSVGEGRMLLVTLRNTGTSTWKGYDAADYTSLLRTDGTFGPVVNGRPVLPGDRVSPGQDYSIRTGITAPTTPGIYTLRFRMRHAPSTMFGPYFVRQIEVVADANPPNAPTVTTAKYSTSPTSLAASWTASDGESGISAYQYAIGVSATYTGTGLLRAWTETGAVTSITASGLTLTEGATYYFYARARNGQGMWSTVGVSPGTTVVRSVSRITDLKALSAGTYFQLQPTLVTCAANPLVFVEDQSRFAGLKVNWTGVAPVLTKLATLTGIYRGIVDYEPTADGLAFDPGSAASARPLGLANRSIGWPGVGAPAHLGLATGCLLVKTWGTVTYTGSGYFLIDDGSRLFDYLAETSRSGVKVALPAGTASPSVGARVTVVGIARIAPDGRRWIMPRTPSDIVSF